MAPESAAHELRFGLHYDFRNPPRWRQAWDRRYGELLEQIEWAERELGFGAFSIAEHHLVDFASSPLTLAAAVAARTTRAWIGTNVLVLPAYHPLRVAEDSLTLDAISGGRFRLGIGLGYREAELVAFGGSLQQRRARAEESLAVLRKAFSGEKFSFAGRYFRFDDVQLHPGPVRAGGPELWVGGLSEPGIERAARAGDGFLCTGVASMAPYLAACRRQGRSGRVALLQSWVVEDDPERSFAQLGAHALYHYTQYQAFGMTGLPELSEPADLLRHGLVSLLDAEGATCAILEAVGQGPVELLELGAVFPGEKVAQASRRMEYFAKRVIPEVRRRLRSQRQLGGPPQEPT